MAMISLKLNEDAHQHIKKKAKSNLRSVTAEINALILNDMSQNQVKEKSILTF